VEANSTNSKSSCSTSGITASFLSIFSWSCLADDTKPYGNILDFRSQQSAVDEAIALFSGETSGEQSREIWLVETMW
jgi:uncharacterized protein YbaA (DUF1428 family)